MTQDNFSLEKGLIETAWENRAELSPDSSPELAAAVQKILNALDNGQLRVASPDKNGNWQTHQWLKKAILLSFRLQPETLITGGGTHHLLGNSAWWDKIPSKFANWKPEDFKRAGFRVVPGAWVRHSAYIAPNVIVMPSFVNIAAHIGAGTMIDTWATVGSCAQVGAGCHISGGAGVGGVLEPVQANPVIIEDNVFIGARSEVVEGVIVRAGAVLSMGVYIGASTKIIRRDTGEITYGEVPPYAVVVPGTLPPSARDIDPAAPRPSLYCAVIIKQVDEQTRSKTSLNDLLRD